MFNDELLIGKFEVTLDAKYRFFIPARSGVESKDKVVLKPSEFKNKKVLKLMDYRKLLEEVNKLKEKQEHATTGEDYLLYEKMIEELCISFEFICNADTQRRIILPKFLAEYINVEPKDVMLFEGLGYSYAISKK